MELTEECYRLAGTHRPEIFRALTRFGAPLGSAGVSAKDFERPGLVYQMGVVPRRVDILTVISGASFDEAWDTRVERVVDGRAVPFIGYETLLKNKRASARPKHSPDVAALEQLAKPRPERG